MNNFYIGKKEAMSCNSNKYGYSLDGICVKVPGGYRSINGTMVHTAVSTDASVIVKETASAASVEKGMVIVMDATPYTVLNAGRINDTTSRFELLNLQSGEVEDKIVDIADKYIGILWDTLKNPSKAVASDEARINLNEFTPQQLFDLSTGKVTLEELRTPKTVESLESVLGELIRKVVATGTEPKQD